MRYQLNEEKGDIRYEVEDDTLILKVKPGVVSGGGSGSGSGDGIYHIKENDVTTPSDDNAFTALRVLKEIMDKITLAMEDANGKYIRKDIADIAYGLITFLSGAEFGEYIEGLSGAKIDADGNAELNSLLVRLKAIVDELQVNGNAEFRGNLSSEEFLSGFVGGKGWAILKQAVTNALGETENKYTAEFDNVVVRGTLRVFTMAISQLLGENDNRIFAGMMEVDHYDAESGKVYLSTNEGRYYNPFRVDDYIMVQQYNGMPSEDNDYYITKHYECIITGAGCGSEEDGENRLDWVTISNFVSADGKTAEEVIKKGDTFTRVDNATDADRKGIIQIITVGTATPYMDIIYGLKTDPDNYLKGRLGNLKGIKHHLFGWLDGFGEYLTNLYAVGDFRLRRTGESLDAAVQMTENQFATNYSKQIQTITEEDNYLTNASFSDMADDAIAESPSWVVDSSDEVVITTSDKQIELDGTTYDAPILFNGALSTTEGKFARVEPYDGRNMLHIRNSKITQLNANIRKPGTHTEYVIPTDSTAEAETKEVKDTLYLTLKFLPKTSGTLTLGMEAADHSEIDAMQYVSKDITSSYDWTTLQVSGTWDGNGDFVLGYTGEMYVALLSLTDKPLEEYKKSVSTNIEQTAEYIRLTGQRIDKSNNEVTNLGIELDAAEARIRSYVENLTAGLSTKIEQTAEKVEIQATRFNDDGTLRNTSGLMTEADRNVLYSEVRDAAGELVNKAEISTSVQYDPNSGNVTSEIKLNADKIYVEGDTKINTNFAVNENGNVYIGKLVTYTPSTTGIEQVRRAEGITVTTDGTIYIGKMMLDDTNDISTLKYVKGITVTNTGETTIGGFTVHSTGYGFSSTDDNAYITISSSSHNRRATIGYDANSSSMGFFENKDSSNVLNTALTIGAANSTSNDNRALVISGGNVRGFAMYTRYINSTGNLNRDDYNLLATNSSTITVYLPQMQLYDNGHVIRIKRLGSGALNIGVQKCYTPNASGLQTPIIVYDGSKALTSGTIALPNVGDACEFVWVNNYGSYGAWIQYKMPQSW